MTPIQKALAPNSEEVGQGFYVVPRTNREILTPTKKAPQNKTGPTLLLPEPPPHVGYVRELLRIILPVFTTYQIGEPNTITVNPIVRLEVRVGGVAVWFYDLAPSYGQKEPVLMPGPVFGEGINAQDTVTSDFVNPILVRSGQLVEIGFSTVFPAGVEEKKESLLRLFYSGNAAEERGPGQIAFIDKPHRGV